MFIYLLLASPHVIGSVLDAIEAMRVALGPGIVLSHVLQGLWHPARKVREVSFSFSSQLRGVRRLIVLCCSNRCIGRFTRRCTWGVRMLWCVFFLSLISVVDLTLIRFSNNQVAYYPSIPDLSDDTNLYERDVSFCFLVHDSEFSLTLDHFFRRF